MEATEIAIKDKVEYTMEKEFSTFSVYVQERGVERPQFIGEINEMGDTVLHEQNCAKFLGMESAVLLDKLRK